MSKIETTLAAVNPNRSTKTLTITLSGGFHNSANKTIRAEIVGGHSAYISERQASDLRKHFCGVGNCACGATMRVQAELPEGWTRTDFRSDGICAYRGEDGASAYWRDA